MRQLFVAQQLQPCEREERVQWIRGTLPRPPFAKPTSLFLAAQNKARSRSSIQPVVKRRNLCWRVGTGLTACENVQRGADPETVQPDQRFSLN